MVHKIRFYIMISLIFLLGFLSLRVKSNVETNLLQAILPKNSANLDKIVPIADKSSSVVKVVFQSDDENNLIHLEKVFKSEIDKNYFDIVGTDVSNLINLYLSNPTNFISDKTRMLLKQHRYEDVYKNSIIALYNPISLNLSTMDKDPFFLSDDFIVSNAIPTDGKRVINNNYYSAITLKIKNNEGLSPDLSNKKISELIKLQNKYSSHNDKIYLSGVPVHSYLTSQKAIFSINIICILSVLLIIFLTYYYFKSIKPIIPISLSILFGILSGYAATNILFNDFHIITMVFSTTIIGLGIDYSYHYFFEDRLDKQFIKKLTFSLLTTIIPFILLYLTRIELFKQISVFTISGLSAIYMFVIIFYPCFNIPIPKASVEINRLIFKKIWFILMIAAIIGMFRFDFNDSLTSLYIPSQKLIKAENLYNQVNGSHPESTKIITISGSNKEEILTREERVTEELSKYGYEYVSVSKFAPSNTKQFDNFNLVKSLYKNKLDNYSEFLSVAQRNSLKTKKFSPVMFDISRCDYLSDFMLDNNTSLIFVFSDNDLYISHNYAKVIDIKKDVSNYMHSYRIRLIKLFPVSILLLYLILSVLYGIKRGLHILLPSITGVMTATGLSLLVFGEMNLFSIISLFLVIGFTMDYSIFSAEPERAARDSVLISCATTAASFFLLSLTGFKLLSTIAFILCIGIITAYITVTLMNTQYKN